MAVRLPRAGRDLERAPRPVRHPARAAPERARRRPQLLGARMGHQARPRPRLRPSRQRRDRQRRSRHSRRRGHLLGRLHRALRLGPCDDARGRRRREPAGLRHVGQGPAEDPGRERLHRGRRWERRRCLQRPGLEVTRRF